MMGMACSLFKRGWGFPSSFQQVTLLQPDNGFSLAWMKPQRRRRPSARRDGSTAPPAAVTTGVKSIRCHHHWPPGIRRLMATMAAAAAACLLPGRWLIRHIFSVTLNIGRERLGFFISACAIWLPPRSCFSFAQLPAATPLPPPATHHFHCH